LTGRDDEERIREIIYWIMDNESEDHSDPGTLHSRLLNMGYSAEEIRQALLLLDADSLRGGILDDTGFDRGTRVLSAIERSILSLEAQGWLLWQRSSGWISETHMTLIIESAALEHLAPVALDDVKEIALRYVPSLPGGDEEDEGRNIN
jgi:uncharacterized protein Smg (DUF494 family)